MKTFRCSRTTFYVATPRRMQRRSAASPQEAARASSRTTTWPGNIREARTRGRTCGGACSRLRPTSHPRTCRRPSAKVRTGVRQCASSFPSARLMEEVERRMIQETLRHTKGDKTLAARLLGIAPRTIYRKLERDGSRVARRDSTGADIRSQASERPVTKCRGRPSAAPTAVRRECFLE